MNRLFFLFCVLGVINCSVAQTVNFSIRAGLNESSLPEIQLIADGQAFGTSYKLPLKLLSGFHAGFYADFGFGSVSVQPGLVYTVIGGHNDTYFIPSYPPNTGAVFYGYKTDKLTYLQIPVDVLYHIPVRFGSVFIGGGPYVGLGLSGSYDIVGNNTLNGISTSTSHLSGKDTFGGNGTSALFQNPDFGAHALAGIIFKNRVLFSAGYCYGIANVSHSNGESKYTNRSIQLSIGYSFF